MHVLVVLGMHRSGTSALARVCNLLGADLGKHLLPARPDNPTGFWELEEISGIHSELLAVHGSRWDDIRELPSNWWKLPNVGAFQDRLINLLRHEFSESNLACIKDPRMCRLLPLWHDIFQNLGWRAHYLFIVRNPAEVAASLAARDGIRPYRSHLIWLRYLLEGERWTRGQTRALIGFDDLLRDWRETMKSAWRRLDLGDLAIDAVTMHIVEGFLQKNLKHHSALAGDREKGESAWVRAVHQNYPQAIHNDAPQAQQALSDVENTLTKAGALLFESVMVDESAARAELEVERQSLAQENVGLRARISQAEAEMETLSEVARQRAAEIARLSHEVTERAREVHAIQASTSWRITAPIRRGKTAIRRLGSVVRAATANHGQWLYYKLPLSADHKLRLKAYLIKYTNLIHRSAGSDDQTYRKWLEHYDTLIDVDREAIRHHIARLERKPVISIVMPVFNTPETFLRCAIQSVVDQLYGHWELCIADDCSSEPHVAKVIKEYRDKDDRIKAVFRTQNGNIAACSNSALNLATGEFIALMDHDDMLPIKALYMVAVAINEHPDAALIYSDEDTIDEHGVRHSAYFKSDWNPDLFYSQNMISHLGVYRSSLVREVSGFRPGLEGSQDYDFALRVIEKAAAKDIIHIPQVLYHWRRCSSATSFSQQQLSRAAAAARRAVRGHFARRGIDVQVELAPGMPQYQRMRWPIPSPPPLVSLIIPIRDNVNLLRQCLNGILFRTDYESVEVLIVNNCSVEAQTFKYLDEICADTRVRVLHYGEPFNYSAINNFGISQARGGVIGLINNDIDVINEDWLTELVGQALRPEVGVVGAKLLYPDNTIQHAGIITGLCGGVAAHGHRRLDRADIGYFGKLKLAQNVSAVTGACLFARREIFAECGGLDETNLAVAYNDVDFCLRVRARGYLIVWTPYAELYHLESASRGSDATSKHIGRFRREQAWMKARWGKVLLKDPYYNPNLTLDREDFSLAEPPRVVKPYDL